MVELLALFHFWHVHKFISERTLMQWLLWKGLVQSCVFVLTAFRAYSRTTSIVISWIESRLSTFISPNILIREIDFWNYAFLFPSRDSNCNCPFYLIIRAEISIPCRNSVNWYLLFLRRSDNFRAYHNLIMFSIIVARASRIKVTCSKLFGYKISNFNFSCLSQLRFLSSRDAGSLD